MCSCSCCNNAAVRCNPILHSSTAQTQNAFPKPLVCSSHSSRLSISYRYHAAQARKETLTLSCLATARHIMKTEYHHTNSCTIPLLVWISPNYTYSSTRIIHLRCVVWSPPVCVFMCFVYCCCTPRSPSPAESMKYVFKSNVSSPSCYVIFHQPGSALNLAS